MSARHRRFPKFQVIARGVPVFTGPYMTAVDVFRREREKDSSVRFVAVKEINN